MTEKQDTSKRSFLSAVLGAVSPTNILTEYFSCFRGYKKTKAYILSWLDNWIYLKLKQGKPPWVYVVCQEIADSIGCCRDTVHRHLKELCDIGILVRLPYKRWATDNIWQYTIDCDRLLQSLFSSFTVSLCKSTTVALYWLRLLRSDVKNQTAECQKSDSRVSEITTPDVEDSATYTSTAQDLLDPPATSNCREIGGQIRLTANSRGEERKQIIDAIDNAPFMQLEGSNQGHKGKGTREKAQGKRHKGKGTRENYESNNKQIAQYLRRLRSIRIPTTEQVSLQIEKTPPSKLESNIQALEELAATKGLKTPLAAFFACIKDNWQPQNGKQAWWTAAAAALGKDRRDRLIAHVIELDRVLTVCFTNGKKLPFDSARAMDWDAIATFGGGA